jgi:tetratricopeptide (TPR) repeat protein
MLIVIFFAYAITVFPNNNNIKQELLPSDSLQILEQYSLFSEYYKNKDYVSALPFGFKVMQLDPAKFAKYFYYKMEDCLWKLHDSSSVDPDLKKSIDDTIKYVYSMALKYYPADKGYWEAKEAYVEETWLNDPADSVISLYENAVKDKPDLSTYYYNRLGQLYINNANGQNNYKSKAIELYSKLNDQYPNDPTWNDVLSTLITNPDSLVVIYKKAWENNKDDAVRAWKYASAAIKAADFKQAVVPLEFLVSKESDNTNYWNQLANAYQKSDQLDKAIDAFKKVIQLDPSVKENYLNLGIAYKDKGEYVNARVQYLKASEVGKGWGLPIYYEGLLYEEAARKCEFNFDTKIVYLLAVETYRRALKLDPTLSQAQERIKALSDSIPTKEDYFFRGIKSGAVLPINGSCYTWINRSVTVP